jgi:hypothetical protein
MYVKLENQEPPTEVEASTQVPLDITTSAHHVDPSEPTPEAPTEAPPSPKIWSSSQVEDLVMRFQIGFNFEDRPIQERVKLDKIVENWIKYHAEKAVNAYATVNKTL